MKQPWSILTKPIRVPYRHFFPAPPPPKPPPKPPKVPPAFRNVDDYFRWSMLARVAPMKSEEVKRVEGFLATFPDHLPDLDDGPLISIILPAFNRQACIGRAIESVRRQTYEHWELLVIDDGSTDGTQDEVGEYLGDERITLHALGANAGVSVARNVGLERSRGELIAYLDSDNEMAPRFLEGMARFLASRPEVDIAYCAQQVFNGTAPPGLLFGPFNRALLENRNYLDLGTVCHRRALFENLGGFDPEMRRLVDWDLLLRYTECAPAAPVPVLGSRYHPGRADNRITSTEPYAAALGVLRRHLEQFPVRLDPTLGQTEAGDGVRGDGVVLAGGEPLWALPSRAIRTMKRKHCRPVTVVIPSFEALPYLKMAIDSVHRYSPDLEIVVVDNASSQPVRNYLQQESRIQLIQNEENFGFTHAVNQGLALAKNDVVLFNNDAVATPGWLDGLWEVLRHYPKTGLVAPRQVLPPRTRTLKVHVPFAEAGHECDVTLSAHHGNIVNPLFDLTRGYVEVNFVPFFCVYIPSGTLDKAPKLNAEHGRHYRSDRLYCDTVRQVLGRKILYTPFSKVYHYLRRSTEHMQQTDPEGYEKMYRRNEW